MLYQIRRDIRKSNGDNNSFLLAAENEISDAINGSGYYSIKGHLEDASELIRMAQYSRALWGGERETLINIRVRIECVIEGLEIGRDC